MKRAYYIYCFRVDGEDLCALWYSNDFDGLHLNEEGKVICFRSSEQAQNYAKRIGLTLQPENCVRLDLDCVARWLDKPTRKGVNCKEFLDAWNLFGDLKSAINQRNMDREDEDYLDVYRKLFWGNNLPSLTPEGKRYVPVWTKKEITELRCALGPSLTAFKQCLLLNDE